MTKKTEMAAIHAARTPDLSRAVRELLDGMSRSPGVLGQPSYTHDEMLDGIALFVEERDKWKRQNDPR